MAPKKGIAAPRAAVEIAESLKLVRQLISVADVQLNKARTDLGVARMGLLQLEEELATLGLEGGAQ